MKIKVEDYMDLIENEKFANKSIAIKENDFSKKMKNTLMDAKSFIEDSLDSGMLNEYQILMGNTEFLLQTGIINLPFQDAKKVRHFFDNEDEVDTKVYLITKSEFINKSKLRIEKISDNSLLNDDDITKTLDIMKQQIATIHENIENQEETEEE